MIEDRLVDALGTFCPVPVRLLARTLASAPPGTTVTLLADDPLVEVDVPAWCHTSGATLHALARGVDGTYRIRVSSPPPKVPR